jgi:acylphosphatase
MTVRRRLVISGRVQGVWFRASCAREAERAGVTGWARNLADGRVEVVLEGAAGPVATVERWCAVGPRGATVTSVEVEDEVPQGTTGFATL